MMRKIVLCALCLTFLGCLKTRAELEDEESQQQQQTQTVAQQKANQQTVKEKAPPAAYRFEEYDEQLRSLTGRVDTLENASTQANANKQADKDSAGKEKQAIDQKFVAYEAALNKLEQQVAALSDEVAKLKAPPPAEAPVAKGKSTYDTGEDQFVAKKWKEAILNYQKYRDANPKGKLFADATYKIGVCFTELGMKDEARAFLEEVTNKYPNSKEAKKAAFRLKTLK